MEGAKAPSQFGSRRIAVVTTSYPRHRGDASGHFVEAEARSLWQDGHSVRVVVPGPFRRARARYLVREPDYEVIQVRGGSAFGFPGMLERIGRAPWRVADVALWLAAARTVLRETPVDEVIAHFLLPCLSPLADVCTCPVTGVAHGSDVAVLCSLPRPALRALLGHWLSRDVRLRFVATRLLSELQTAAGEPYASELAARSSIRPAALSIPDTPAGHEARARLDLGTDFVALCVSRLVRGKNVERALDQAPVPPGTKWFVIGDGPERHRLERRYSRVTFLGRLDRETTLLWISAANVLVHSSRREGAPSVVREARALGTEVWCGDVGDVRSWSARDRGIHILSELT